MRKSALTADLVRFDRHLLAKRAVSCENRKKNQDGSRRPEAAPPSGRPRCGNGPLPRNRETGPVISCILKNAQNLTAPHLSARSVSPWPLWAPGGHGGPLVRGAAAGGRGIPEWRAPDSTPGSGRNTRRRGSRSRQGTRGADAHPGGGVRSTMRTCRPGGVLSRWSPSSP